MTFIDDEDDEPPYHAHSATLRVIGDIGDPDALTWSTELEPTRVFRRGDRRPAGPLGPDFRGWRGREPAPHDYWAWTAPEDEEQAMDAHLRALADAFEHRIDVLRAQAPRARIDVFLGYRSNQWEGGFDVGADTLARLGTLGLHVSVSVIVT